MERARQSTYTLQQNEPNFSKNGARMRKPHPTLWSEKDERGNHKIWIDQATGCSGTMPMSMLRSSGDHGRIILVILFWCIIKNTLQTSNSRGRSSNLAKQTQGMLDHQVKHQKNGSKPTRTHSNIQISNWCFFFFGIFTSSEKKRLARWRHEEGDQEEMQIT
jgi:hypothetical protein